MLNFSIFLGIRLKIIVHLILHIMHRKHDQALEETTDEGVSKFLTHFLML